MDNKKQKLFPKLALLFSLFILTYSTNSFSNHWQNNVRYAGGALASGFAIGATAFALFDMYQVIKLWEITHKIDQHAREQWVDSEKYKNTTLSITQNIAEVYNKTTSHLQFDSQTVPPCMTTDKMTCSDLLSISNQIGGEAFFLFIRTSISIYTTLKSFGAWHVLTLGKIDTPGHRNLALSNNIAIHLFGLNTLSLFIQMVSASFPWGITKNFGILKDKYPKLYDIMHFNHELCKKALISQSSIVALNFASMLTLNLAFVHYLPITPHNPGAQLPRAALALAGALEPREDARFIEVVIEDRIPSRALQQSLECMICAAVFTEEAPRHINPLPCSHNNYHLSCILQWFAYHSRCPECNHPVSKYWPQKQS